MQRPIHFTLRLFFAATLLLAPLVIRPQQTNYKETDWKPPLVSGGAPTCPDHEGTRYLNSETGSMRGVQLVIAGATTKTAQRCSYTAELKISGRLRQTIRLDDTNQSDENIADFSPDGSSLLMYGNLNSPYPFDDSNHLDYRDVRIGIINLAHPELPHWVNAWDLFGWGKCDATVEPQGFTPDGRVLVLARPSTWSSKWYKNCVDDWGLYATDLQTKPVRVPDSTKVPRFGEDILDSSAPCKSDPDVVAACFTFRGRMSLYNGCCTARMWWVGTHRMLAQDDDIPLPAILQDKMNWDVNGWGDFEVCPLVTARPGYMQMVCVQSVHHLAITPQP